MQPPQVYHEQDLMSLMNYQTNEQDNALQPISIIAFRSALTKGWRWRQRRRSCLLAGEGEYDVRCYKDDELLLALRMKDSRGGCVLWQYMGIFADSHI